MQHTAESPIGPDGRVAGVHTWKPWSLAFSRKQLSALVETKQTAETPFTVF
jgi:hypothetical protein